MEDNRLLFQPTRLISWDRCYGVDSPERVSEPYPYGAIKTYALKVYPAVGRNTSDGHNMVYRSVGTWEADVFAFFTAHVQRVAADKHLQQ